MALARAGPAMQLELGRCGAVGALLELVAPGAGQDPAMQVGVWLSEHVRSGGALLDGVPLSWSGVLCHLLALPTTLGLGLER